MYKDFVELINMGNTFMVLNNNFNSLFTKKMQIVMIGLDGAGKTTILYRLSLKEDIHTTLPTTAFNVETIRPFKNLKFMVWDTAGNDTLRPLWKTYTRKSDAMIFVVDSSDEERFDEARVELDHILSCSDSRGIPILILANKQDLSESVTPVELSQKLELDNLNNSINWNLHPTSGRFGDGLQDAMIQLAEMIETNRKQLKRARSGSGSRTYSTGSGGGTSTVSARFQNIEASKFV